MNTTDYITRGLARITTVGEISDPTVTTHEVREAVELGASYGELTERQQAIINDLSPKPVRQCGTCSVCCRAPAIEPIAILPRDNIDPKPCGETCRHCISGGGCDRYDNRPNICRSYQCLWVLGVLPEKHMPEDVGVCWTFQANDGGLLLMGHAFDLQPVLKDRRNMAVISDFLQREGMVGVTIRTPKEAISFLPNGIAAHALIDQSDPLKQKIDHTTERHTRFEFGD